LFATILVATHFSKKPIFLFLALLRLVYTGDKPGVAGPNPLFYFVTCFCGLYSLVQQLLSAPEKSYTL